MKDAIPSRPALLVAFLGYLLSGDEKHQQDSVLTPELRAELIARKAQLETLDNRIQLSKGQLRQDTQDRRDLVQAILPITERARDVVLAKYGHTDPVLVDFHVAPRTKRHQPGTEGAAQSTAARASKKLASAQSKLVRAQAQLERAKDRLAKAEANVTRRETEVGAAGPTPVPPSSQSEGGTPSSPSSTPR